MSYDVFLISEFNLNILVKTAWRYFNSKYFFSNFDVTLVAYFSSLSLLTKMKKTQKCSKWAWNHTNLLKILWTSVFDGFLWHFFTMLSLIQTLFEKCFFWQFSYPYGYLIYEVTTYYYGRTIQLQILLMVFKCYIWGLPWKYYGISISFQSQKWIRLVIKRLLPNNLWYWWLYQSSKVKNCDISKCQKWWLNRSSIELFKLVIGNHISIINYW